MHGPHGAHLHLRKSSGCRTIRYEPAEASAGPSEDLVERVDGERDTEQTKHAAERPNEFELREQQDTSTPVARDRRTIEEYEPPILPTPFFRHRGQQEFGLLIAERK